MWKEEWDFGSDSVMALVFLRSTPTHRIFSRRR